MKLKDYDEVVAVWRRAGLDCRPSGRESRKSIKRQLAEYGNLMIVAEDNDQIIGVAIGSHDHRKGWINRLAVLPEWRRRGVAKALIGRLEDEFKKLDIKIFCALILEGNEESISLFENSGYEQIKVKYLSKRSNPDV